MLLQNKSHLCSQRGRFFSNTQLNSYVPQLHTVGRNVSEISNRCSKPEYVNQNTQNCSTMTLRACLRKNHANMENSCGSKFEERTEFYHIFKGYILRVRYITFVLVQDVSIYSNGRYCNLVMMPLKYRKFKEKLSISVNYYKFVNNI